MTTTYTNHIQQSGRYCHHRQYHRASGGRGRRVLFIAITVVVILLGIVMGNDVLNASSSSAYTDVQTEVRYTSIQVEEGDTLWTIAESYMCPEYRDLNEYIAEVVSINHLEDGDSITAGGYLMVPYYEAVSK